MHEKQARWQLISSPSKQCPWPQWPPQALTLHHICWPQLYTHPEQQALTGTPPPLRRSEYCRKKSYFRSCPPHAICCQVRGGWEGWKKSHLYTLHLREAWVYPSCHTEETQEDRCSVCLSTSLGWRSWEIKGGVKTVIWTSTCQIHASNRHCIWQTLRVWYHPCALCSRTVGMEGTFLCPLKVLEHERTSPYGNPKCIM